MLQAFVIEKTGRFTRFSCQEHMPQSKGQPFLTAVFTLEGLTVFTGALILSKNQVLSSAIIVSELPHEIQIFSWKIFPSLSKIRALTMSLQVPHIPCVIL
jgi:hypothetical protein